MRRSRIWSTLVPSLLLTVLPQAASRGTGRQAGNLRSQAFRSGASGPADQDPSPAEVEEEEENDGVQEQTLDRPRSAPRDVVQASASQPAAQEAKNPQVAGASVRILPPESTVPSLPSMIMDGVVGPNLPEGRAEGYNPQNSLLQDSRESPEDRPGAAGHEEELQKILPSQTHVSRKAPSASVPAESMPSPAPPEKTQERATAAVVPTSTSPQVAPGTSKRTFFGDAASAEKLFPTALPKHLSDAHEGVSLQAEPRPGFEAVDKTSYETCDPPCHSGRGMCNDNVCFCKSPYMGTTCQNKASNLIRIPLIVVAVFGVVSIGLGMILARGAHSLLVSSFDAKNSLGEKEKVAEIWAPPSVLQGRSHRATK